VTEIGDSIAHTLKNYSTKFTRMRSDNELFAEKITREMERIEDFKARVAGEHSVIGKILAQLTESVIATYCIHIHEQAGSN
jgi:hypothetical protein